MRVLNLDEWMIRTLIHIFNRNFVQSRCLLAALTTKTIPASNSELEPRSCLFLIVLVSTGWAIETTDEHARNEIFSRIIFLHLNTIFQAHGVCFCIWSKEFLLDMFLFAIPNLFHSFFQFTPSLMLVCIIWISRFRSDVKATIIVWFLWNMS